MGTSVRASRIGPTPEVLACVMVGRPSDQPSSARILVAYCVEKIRSVVTDSFIGKVFVLLRGSFPEAERLVGVRKTGECGLR
jgi:hypothetical protein